MRNYVPILLAVMFALVLLASCKEKAPPPPPQAPPPPEPTAEEIYREMRGGLQMFWDPIEGKAPGLEDGPRDQGIAHLTTCKGKYSSKENGRAALERIGRDIDNIIREAKEGNRWKLIKGCCMLYQVVEPGSDRYKKVEERADLMLARPDVHVRGFVQIGNDLYAFLEVLNLKTREVSTFKVREGEEFYDVLRLMRIVGNQQAVEILYIPANDTWTVQGPRQL